MLSIFCCSNLQPFRPTRTDHEAKFMLFLGWGKSPTVAAVVNPATGAESLQHNSWPYAIQLVKQVNYGPLESKRYFVPLGDDAKFKEITERDLIEANFTKVNSYKNFKCTSHNKFFELNLYQKDPVNRHHWRANIARPAEDIDLDASHGAQVSTSRNTSDESKVDSAKPATNFDDSIARVLTRIPKMSLEEATEGASSIGVDERAGGLLKEEDGEWDDYVQGRYDNEGENLDYTACSLECGYCGHCDY